jgi:hypothetical protein
LSAFTGDLTGSTGGFAGGFTTSGSSPIALKVVEHCSQVQYRTSFMVHVT